MKEIKFRLWIGGDKCVYWGFIDGSFIGVPIAPGYPF